MRETSSTSNTSQAFRNLVVLQDEYFQLFLSHSTKAEREVQQRLWDDPAILQVQSMIQEILKTSPEGPFPVSAEEWFAAATAKINVMKEVDDGLASGLLEQSSASARAAVGDLAAVSCLFLVVLLVSILLIVNLTRSILRGFRTIEESAENVAWGMTQIAGSAQELASGASEQAASVELNPCELSRNECW